MQKTSTFAELFIFSSHDNEILQNSCLFNSNENNMDGYVSNMDAIAIWHTCFGNGIAYLIVYTVCTMFLLNSSKHDTSYKQIHFSKYTTFMEGAKDLQYTNILSFFMLLFFARAWKCSSDALSFSVVSWWCKHDRKFPKFPNLVQ